MDEPTARLAHLLADPRSDLRDTEDFGAALAALADIATENNWHYLYLLCLAHLRSQGSGAARSFMARVTKDKVIEALITNHRINEALHLRLADGEDDPTAGLPLQLPARRWNLPGTDRLVEADDVRRMLLGIQQEASRKAKERHRRWIASALIRRFKAINDRMKDAVLMQLMRHAGALNGMQWRRLTRRSQHDAVHVRLHYASGFLTASVGVAGLIARKITALPILFAPTLDDSTRRRIDSHFAARIVSAQVYELLLALRSPKADPLPHVQRFHDLLLRDVLAQPDVARAIHSLGDHPTMIVATHGALAQIPFAALHDGRQFLGERFNIVQAPPLYSDQPFATGDMDYEAMTGREPIGMPRSIRVMADTIALQGARKEVEHYRALQAQGVDMTIRDGTTNEPWSADMLRRVISEPGVALLSCHMEPSPSGVAETQFLTPDGARVRAADLLNAPLHADLLVLAGCVSLAKTDWFGSVEDSLASRLRKAGVQSVVTTLWHVSDAAARHYNETLVMALSEGRSRVAAHGAALRALRRLQINVFTGEATGERKIVQYQGADAGPEVAPSGTYDHPYYWAPFVLSGAWR